MKAKNSLKTISPVTVNWLKDCDVTWLYGPLHSTPAKLDDTLTERSGSSHSKAESTVNIATPKPILKKRPISESLLQRSISSASALKQASVAPCTM